jgi:predicted AlkP superfamily phosphohydrolase/phosphomutase
LAPEISLAYIDPGTGGMVISSMSLLGIILASTFSFILAFILKPVWNRALKPVGKLLKMAVLKLWIYKKTFFKGILLLILAAGALFIFQKKSMLDSTPKKYNKVIVLGIDGFDPKIMEFLMNEGKLENFKKLKEAGIYKRLETITPSISPVVWTTIATGVNPGKHGIFDFIRFDREKNLPYLSIIDQEDSFLGTKFVNPVKRTPFWKTLSDASVFVSSIHWPVTFPAEDISGNMFSGLGTPDIRGFLNGYIRYTSKKINDPLSQERIIFVENSGGQVQSELQGPYKSSGEILTEPFVVQIADENSASLVAGGTSYPLKKGEWSDWVSVRFKQGFGRNVDAIFKVYAESFSPEFDIFATSLQFDPGNPGVKISSPEDYAKTLSAEIGKFYTLGMPEDAKAVNDFNLSKDALEKQIDEIRIEREKMFWTEYKKMIANSGGVLAFVFDETDRAEHIFYDQEIAIESGKVRSVGDFLAKVYTDKDKFLGEIMEKLPKDAALMVVSDHGFEKFKRAVNLNSWLLENGYLTLKPGITADNAGTLYKNVDWEKTKAYSFGYVSININIKGREKYGAVEAGEKDALVDEIIGKLKQFKDPQNGEIIPDKVFKKDELYSGPYIDGAGDIVVGFKPPYRIDWENPVGGFSTEAVSDNTRPWQADHIFSPSFVPGIFFSNFKINSQTPRVLDIAPTIFDLLQREAPSDYDGKSLIK